MHAAARLFYGRQLSTQAAKLCRSEIAEPPNSKYEAAIKNLISTEVAKGKKAEREFERRKKKDLELKRANDFNYLKVPLGHLNRRWLHDPAGLTEIAHTALHYNVLPHVFGVDDAVLTKTLSVRYPEGWFVQRGNLVTPTQTQSPPTVSFNSDEKAETLWTVVMTTPDGNLFSAKSEVLHWLVCDIPGNDFSKGHTLCQYLPPIPVEGTGYHRYVFGLLRQNGPLRLRPAFKVNDNKLQSRTWSTEHLMKTEGLELYGLSFFQAQWDKSVAETFQHLGFPEPVYELEQTKAFNMPVEERAALFKQRGYFSRVKPPKHIIKKNRILRRL